jgi:hypothetical protein
MQHHCKIKKTKLVRINKMIEREENIGGYGQRSMSFE